MAIPHLQMRAKDFIDYVNKITMDDSKRCRILIAEVLLKMQDREDSEALSPMTLKNLTSQTNNIKESIARWFEDGLEGKWDGRQIAQMIRSLK